MNKMFYYKTIQDVDDIKGWFNYHEFYHQHLVCLLRVVWIRFCYDRRWPRLRNHNH